MENTMNAWGNLQKDQDSWTLAKMKMGVQDVRELSSKQFHDLVALAQEIKEGHVNVDAL